MQADKANRTQWVSASTNKGAANGRYLLNILTQGRIILIIKDTHNFTTNYALVYYFPFHNMETPLRHSNQVE